MKPDMDLASAEPLSFAYAYGAPTMHASFKSIPEDFVVEERLGFLPSGDGEHIYVLLTKRGENTQWVADRLAEFLCIKRRDIGFSGMKDRVAVSTQWFSAHLPRERKDIDWSCFAKEANVDVQILETCRHDKKLRRGVHQANRFCVRLKHVSGFDMLTKRLEKVRSGGVPNYFGEQRFGRLGANLDVAFRWFSTAKPPPRTKRGIIISAARSYVFNIVLSRRVADGTWSAHLIGDVLDEHELPTGPLWGRGRSATESDALRLENEALKDLSVWCDGLEHVGLQQERRSLVLRPHDMSWQIEDDEIVVQFELGAGQFATSVLRELCQLKSRAAAFSAATNT